MAGPREQNNIANFYSKYNDTGNWLIGDKRF